MEQWAELRREQFVRGVSIGELIKPTGLARNTIRRALRSGTPPPYRRKPSGSKLDPHKHEIHRLPGEDPKLPGVVIRERLDPLDRASPRRPAREP